MNIYVYIAFGIVFLLTMALCAVAGSESDIEEKGREEHASNRIFEKAEKNSKDN